MSAGVQLTDDLAIGRENPQRPEGSVILRRWLADRRATEAREQMQQSRRIMRRNYAAAKTSLTNSGWTTMPTPPNWSIWQGLQALRSRSREQYRNNDYARRFVMMCKNNIIGATGIGLQAKAADPDGTPDKLANDAIEAAWAEWSRRWCDVAGRQTMADLCRTIIGTIAMDGECLVQRIPGGPFGLQLKLIDPELLDILYNDRLPNGNVVRMGVEMDRNGRHVAYHMLDQSASDVYQVSYYSGANHHIRVDASEILHLFLPEMIGQARGVPWMASALVRMKNLHAYEEAAVVAARVGASKMGFFKSTDGEGAGGLADDEDADTGEFIQDAEAGAFEVLPEGYSFESFNPDYPHQQFGDFVKASLRGIAAGLGVSYNGLANDLEGVNFSSIRAGVLEEREQWKALQDWFIEAFMRPVFEDWLSTQLAIGSIKVPTKQNGMTALPAGRFEKFRKVTFMPRRWAWVDPQKDMDAAVIAIQNGLKSPQRIAAEQGIDVDEVLDEIATFQAKVRDKGIALTGTTFPSSAEAKPASSSDNAGGANA